ncbi:MAG TPA: hypothetical protein VFB12_16560 [Ktedonobacteraceae bacterium]|nr:hypothetical protein [Ktedonobacteraceae bacterium]
MHTFSNEAMDRPHRAIKAAGILRERAWAIEGAAADAGADEIIVAVVGKDLTFGGIWTAVREDLMWLVPRVEGQGGWSLIFSPKTSSAQVEERCMQFARIAFKRWEAMQRWAGRQARKN